MRTVLGFKAETPATKAPVVAPKVQIKQIRSSDICGAGDRISVMLDRLKDLQKQTDGIRASMESALAEAAAGGESGSLDVRRLQCARRVAQLKIEADGRRQEIARLRNHLGDVRVQQTQRLDQLHCSQDALRKAKADQDAKAEGFPKVFRSLRTQWRQLRCRRMRLLHEVFQVYPVEKEAGDHMVIRKLVLTNIETLCRQDLREEEAISTALGFLAHLFVTLAGILEVPLRVIVHQAGCSRCQISDPHECSAETDGGISREWPLYYSRGQEKARFERALHLLHDGLNQFLYSRGYFNEKLVSNGNLLELVDLIRQKEMNGA